MPHNQCITLNLINIIGMQWTTKVDHHIVGDVNKRTDRTLANGCQPLCHPVRAGGIRHLFKSNTGDGRAQMILPGKL